MGRDMLWRWRVAFDTEMHPHARTPGPWNYSKREPIIGVSLAGTSEGMWYEVEGYEQVIERHILRTTAPPSPDSAVPPKTTATGDEDG